MIVQNGCSGCQGGLGSIGPEGIPFIVHIEAWFAERGIDWRVALGIVALAVVSVLYMSTSREE